jgi:hypothetical protein
MAREILSRLGSQSHDKTGKKAQRLLGLHEA